MPRPFHANDQEQVLHHLGPMVPQLCREAIEDGFFNYSQNRLLDPGAAASYTRTTEANILYDRIVQSARELIGLTEDPSLELKMTQNQRSTELMVGAHLAVRLKKVKPGRGFRSANYMTNRQHLVRSAFGAPPEQLSLDLPVVAPGLPRLYLTVGYALDVLEEEVQQVRVGVELEKKWLWSRSVAPFAEVDALPLPVADRVIEMRERRSA